MSDTQTWFGFVISSSLIRLLYLWKWWYELVVFAYALFLSTNMLFSLSILNNKRNLLLLPLPLKGKDFIYKKAIGSRQNHRGLCALCGLKKVPGCGLQVKKRQLAIGSSKNLKVNSVVKRFRSPVK